MDRIPNFWVKVVDRGGEWSKVAEISRWGSGSGHEVGRGDVSWHPRTSPRRERPVDSSG